MKKALFLLFIVLTTLTAACSRVTREQAEAAAMQFMKEHVRFVPKGEKNQSINAYVAFSPDSYETKDSWVLIVKAKGEKENQTLKNDLTIEVSKKTGRVVRFQGRPVPG